MADQGGEAATITAVTDPLDITQPSGPRPYAAAFETPSATGLDDRQWFRRVAAALKRRDREVLDLEQVGAVVAIARLPPVSFDERQGPLTVRWEIPEYAPARITAVRIDRRSARARLVADATRSAATASLSHSSGLVVPLLPAFTVVFAGWGVADLAGELWAFAAGGAGGAAAWGAAYAAANHDIQHLHARDAEVVGMPELLELVVHAHLLATDARDGDRDDALAAAADSAVEELAVGVATALRALHARDADLGEREPYEILDGLVRELRALTATLHRHATRRIPDPSAPSPWMTRRSRKRADRELRRRIRATRRLESAERAEALGELVRQNLVDEGAAG
jgi:hypothetical protein